MQITIQVTDNTPQLKALQRLFRRPRAVTAAAAGGVAKLWRAHFRQRNTEGNQMGWPSSGFFAREGKGTKVDRDNLTDTAATVLVPSRALAFRMRGGTIRPGAGKKYLALPATAEAYKLGKPSARDGGREELAFAFARHPHGGMRPALVRRLRDAEAETLAAKAARAAGAKSASGRTRAEAALAKEQAKTAKRGREHEVQYWLVRRATIQADARILPPELVTQMEAVEAARDRIFTILRAAESAAAPTQDTTS